MLKNISKEPINLQWGGVAKQLNSDECCDVGVTFKEVGAQITYVEDRFVKKFLDRIIKGNFDTPVAIGDKVDIDDEPLQEKKLRGRPRKE